MSDSAWVVLWTALLLMCGNCLLLVVLIVVILLHNAGCLLQ